jgi:glycosyltransferase involved in cell wall biosynthesis
MRIAYSVVKNIRRGGGIEKYTFELGRRMVARGHEVTVYSMGHYGTADVDVEGMKIVHVPALQGAATEKLSAGGWAALQLMAGGGDFDVVHCHSVAAGAFGLLPHLRGLRTVLQMHGVEWQRSRWSKLGVRVLRLLEQVSLHSHHAYTAVSNTQCAFYRESYGVAMRYIPTGAEVQAPVEPREILKLGLRPQRYVLFAARLVREKGAHYLIEAFRKLDTKQHLVVAGDVTGEEDYKQELKALAGDDPRIIFTGYVEGRLLHELFGHAALYVQPSEIEGLSIALLEAMSYGLGCLVSDIPENYEAIAETGETFRSRDVGDLRERLEALLADEGRCARLGAAARERVRRHYSWDRIADDFEALYTCVARVA